MIPIFNREVAGTIRSVFEKPADEEPSRLYGGLTVALGVVAASGSIILSHELPISFDVEFAGAYGGILLSTVGAYEYYLADRNRQPADQ